MSSVSPPKGDPVTLDASGSVDRRGDYYPNGQDESYYASHAQDRLHYHWTISGENSAAMRPERSSGWGLRAAAPAHTADPAHSVGLGWADGG